jgi:hypothetical protein
VVQLKLLGFAVTEGLGLATNTQRINLGLVVTASLISANEQLDLQVFRDVGTGGETDTSTRHLLVNATSGCRDECRRGLEGLGDGHLALLHVAEIRLPRDVDAGRVVLPCDIHLIDIVRGVTLKEGVAGGLWTMNQYKLARYLY